MNTRFCSLIILILIVVFNAVAQEDTPFKKKAIEARMMKVAEWQLAHPNHELYQWTNAAFYAGIFAAYETTKSPELIKALMDMGEKNQWKTGPRYDHADDIAISQTYIDLYRLKKDKKMIQPTIDTVNRLKTEPGEHVKKNGITWWWCDALFMGPPTLVKLAETTGDKTYLQLNDKLFRETNDRLYDPTKHL